MSLILLKFNYCYCVNGSLIQCQTEQFIQFDGHNSLFSIASMYMKLMTVSGVAGITNNQQLSKCILHFLLAQKGCRLNISHVELERYFIISY